LGNNKNFQAITKSFLANEKKIVIGSMVEIKHLWATIKMFLGDDQKKIWMVMKKFQLLNLTIEIIWSHSLAL
jgi:hypothetical protein